MVADNPMDVLSSCLRITVQFSWHAELDATDDAESSDDDQHAAGSLYADNDAISHFQPGAGTAGQPLNVAS